MSNNSIPATVVHLKGICFEGFQGCQDYRECIEDEYSISISVWWTVDQVKHRTHYMARDRGNENDKKKLKGDKLPCCPSRVVHLRQLPSDVTEAEVISLGIPFGKITNLLVLKGKSQAFLEMASEEAAVTMVNYYSLAIPYLRNQPIYVQFSNHKELKTGNLPSQARAQAALQAVNAVQSESLAAASALPSEGVPLPCQGPVLRIIVENVFYPVSLETLYQVFCKFGSVLKVIIFTRNNQFQALLQYADAVNAYHAKMALDGQSIYTGCCILRIDFSKLTDLKVKYNNEKSRDFTRHDLPSGDGQPPLEQPIAGPFGSQNVIFPPYAGAAGYSSPMGFTQGAGLSVPAPTAILGSHTVTMSAVSGHRTILPVTAVSRNSVVLVSNLNPQGFKNNTLILSFKQAITLHGLFTLFGVYGNVHRVKIMFKKRENALVQMADTTQAHLAISYLNGQRLYGRVLHATLSKYQTVQLPCAGQQHQGLTKDYSNSPLHRFKKPGSRNSQNIYPPSATLHLSNIPPSVTVDDLKNLFANKGSTVKAFRFFERDCRMALIQLGSVEEALHALIELHNHDFGENRHLRVSFSKSTI